MEPEKPKGFLYVLPVGSCEEAWKGSNKKQVLQTLVEYQKCTP